jgi:hypothetical protein
MSKRRSVLSSRGIRQQAHLDAHGGVHLARHARGLVAQLAALALRLGKRADHRCREHGEGADHRPREVEQHVEVAKRDDADQHEDQHEHRREVDALQGGQARNEPGEREAGEHQRDSFEVHHCGRANEAHPVEEVLDHLRVQRHPGNEFAQRRRLVVEDALAAHAQQHHLVSDAVRIDLPAEDLGRAQLGHVVVMAHAHVDRAVVVHRRGDVADAKREQASGPSSMRIPASIPTRSVSTESAGTKAPCTLEMSGITRTTTSCCPEFIMPRPAAAASITGTLPI